MKIKLNRFVEKILNLSTATVLEVNQPSTQFYSIRFQTNLAKQIDWQHGDKIKINFDLMGRTFTPLFWNKETGESELLLFNHANHTLASDWLQALKKNDHFKFQGPRKSLVVNQLPEELIFFGDETSFATAHTVKNAKLTSANIQYFFEVSDFAESKKILSYLDLEATLITKQSDALENLLNNFSETLHNNEKTTLVLTGKTQSIQQIRKGLSKAAISMKRLKVKAYWAEGKKGLD